MNKKFIPLAFAASLLFAACSDDQTEVVNNGPEITFRTSVSRAQNVDGKELKSFKVWAFANEVSYEGTPFIDGLIATKDETVTSSNVFKFDHSIFWPNDVPTFNFWAISPYENLNVNHDAQTMRLNNYLPDKDYEKQSDVIVAFNQVTRSVTQGTSVSLDFKHILSMILVSAQAGVNVKNENRSVKVRGAWLVNIGTNASASRSTTSGENENKVSWSNCSATAQYGKYFDEKVLSNDPKSKTNFFSFNAKDLNSDKSNMLLIPQQLTAWDGTETGTGAYILLLCRVEATHTGALHTGAKDDPMVKSEGGNHIHQLFPHDGAATSFDDKAYGYACVPIGTLWEYGKVYRYTLDLCGINSGAGIYPPVNLPELPGTPPSGITIIGTPDGKVGKPVLDEPIKFTVTVNPWDDDPDHPETWNPGDVNLQ